MGGGERGIGRTNRERNGDRLFRWRRMTFVSVAAAVSAAPRTMRAIRPPLQRVTCAQSKSERDQRRGMAIARQKIRRVLQRSLGNARARSQLTRFVQTSPIRFGMESRAAWKTQFPLPRAFSAVGALFGCFRQWQRSSQK